MVYNTTMEKKQKPKGMYAKLFFSTMVISAFTIGGGYVIVPMMKKRFVEEYGWLEEEEMIDLVAIAQSSPGPIAINASVLVGYRMGGIPGALLTALGTMLPPMLIIAFVSVFYNLFKDNPAVRAILGSMQIGSAAVIIGVVVKMGRDVFKQKSFWLAAIMLLCFAAASFLGISAVLLILGCCLIGVVVTLVGNARKKNEPEKEENENDTP